MFKSESQQKILVTLTSPAAGTRRRSMQLLTQNLFLAVPGTVSLDGNFRATVSRRGRRVWHYYNLWSPKRMIKKKSTFFLARSPVDFSHHQLRLPFKTKPIEMHQIFRGRFHLNTRSWASKVELLKICCWRHTVNINFMISTLGSWWNPVTNEMEYFHIYICHNVAIYQLVPNFFGTAIWSFHRCWGTGFSDSAHLEVRYVLVWIDASETMVMKIWSRKFQWKWCDVFSHALLGILLFHNFADQLDSCSTCKRMNVQR